VEYKRNRGDEERKRTEEERRQKEREDHRAEREKRREQEAAVKDRTGQEQLEKRRQAERIRASEQERIAAQHLLERTQRDARVGEMEQAIARQKSYVGAAVLTFLLYCLGYLPGLIVNCLYLDDARKTAKVAGVTPTGVGCLWLMLVLGLLPLVLLLLIIGSCIAAVPAMRSTQEAAQEATREARPLEGAEAMAPPSESASDQEHGEMAPPAESASHQEQREEEARPVEQKDFEIVSVDSRVMETNSVYWQYSWIVKVRNNTDGVLRLTGEVVFLDGDGFKVDSSSVLDQIPPGTQTIAGECLVRTSKAPNVRRVEAKLERSPF
jgi:hypothetical protein